MLKITFVTLWAVLVLPAQSLLLRAEILEFGPETVLVYQNRTQDDRETQFVIRIGRFKPDIVLEWESLSHQGTVHLFEEAVRESETFTLSALFEPGVDIESDDSLTKWLSRDLYQKILDETEVELRLNRSRVQFQLTGEDTRTVMLNKQPVEVPVILLQDTRDGSWAFQKSQENPVLVEYVSPYYRETLDRVSTESKMGLRWIPALPPIH